MGCAKKGCGVSQDMTDEHRSILRALAAQDEPQAGKEIATLSGIDGKSISNNIKALRNKGYVESPVRCKYTITDSGKEALS